MTKSKNRSKDWIMCGLITIIMGILPVMFFNLWLLGVDPGWDLLAIPIMSGILMLIGIMVILVVLEGDDEIGG